MSVYCKCKCIHPVNCPTYFLLFLQPLISLVHVTILYLFALNCYCNYPKFPNVEINNRTLFYFQRSKDSGTEMDEEEMMNN